ncbi:hypothetical protein ACFL1M_03905 [Patescibacteria group bacterium]
MKERDLSRGMPVKDVGVDRLSQLWDLIPEEVDAMPLIKVVANSGNERMENERD